MCVRVFGGCNFGNKIETLHTMENYENFNGTFAIKSNDRFAFMVQLPSVRRAKARANDGSGR